MGAFEFIRREWHVLKGAPFSFIGLAVLCLGLGFAGGTGLRAQQIANLESLVRVKDAERELSQQQLTDIKSKLQTQTGQVTIEGSDVKKHVANQLKDVFTDSGWQVHTDTSPNDKSTLILRAQEGKDASTIEQALKHAGVNYEAVPLDGKTNFKLGVPKM